MVREPPSAEQPLSRKPRVRGPGEDDSRVVRLLLAIRLRFRWTQVRLANELCVHPSTIANWESGASEPHPSWIQRLEVILDADPASLPSTAQGTQPDDPSPGES